MTDHKTVREALELEVKLIERTILNIENGKYRRVNGNELYEMLNGQKERIVKALAALDRIEGVETVTVEEVAKMLFNVPFPSKPQISRVSRLVEKFPNGLRIVKEK